MIRSIVAAAAAIVLSVASLGLRADTAPTYTVEDIGSLGGAQILGVAINDNGDIAGYGQTDTGETHAFRYSSSGGLVDLGAMGTTFAQATAINNPGDIVGNVIDAAGNRSAFIARHGEAMQPLLHDGVPIDFAAGINDDGVITGFTLVPGGTVPHAFRFYPTGALEDLGNGDRFSTGLAINAHADVTGWELPGVAGGPALAAFRFSTSGGFVSLGTFGGSTSAGLGINASGAVTGWDDLASGTSHGFRALPGMAVEDLGTLGSISVGQGINDDGAVVGWSIGSDAQSHAFVFLDGFGMVDLNDRIPAGSAGGRLDSAFGINKGGQIVATYVTGTTTGTLRLTPNQADTTPPVIASVTATPSQLWPPNGTMRPVAFDVVATDDRDPNPTCRIESVSMTEGGTTSPAGDAAQLTGDLSLDLLAARTGSDKGRTYTVTIGCTDASGNRAGATALVMVPHDQSDH